MGKPPLVALPVDAILGDLRDAMRRRQALVVTAPPGTGKTTRIPPALCDDGPVLLLQPRRAAARAIARRIAEEQGWTLGREVGWQMRHDTCASADTRLLVATEGILTARLQQDPLLSDFRTVVLDEFHERSLHADVGLALMVQALRARADLRLVVMSATLDPAPLGAWLGTDALFAVEGRRYPVRIEHAPGLPPDAAVQQLLGATAGSILLFVPGSSDVRHWTACLRRVVAAAIDVVPLHGGLLAAEQDLALADTGRRRVVVCTNIAETSVTVPGVTGVVDTGLVKVARYDAARAVDLLTTERVTADAADQRAGRAGRTAPGHVLRLWEPSDRLRPSREPDVLRVDLSGLVADVAAWGGTVASLQWLLPPPPAHVAAAERLLTRLGALRDGQLTPLGQAMQRLPVPPRLARVLLAGGGAPPVTRAVVLLTARTPLPATSASTACDLLASLDAWHAQPATWQRDATVLQDQVDRVVPSAERARTCDEEHLCRALLAGYPDRVAQRRQAHQPRVKLATGQGARLASTSRVTADTYLVALDLQGSNRDGDDERLIRLASRVDAAWLTPDARETVHLVDTEGTARAVERTRYGAIVLSERVVPVDPSAAAAALGHAWLARPQPDEVQRWLRRAAFAGVPVDLEALVAQAVYGCRRLSDVNPLAHVPHALIATVDRDAPATLTVPSGRQTRLEYHEDGRVSAEVKLQELFGWRETPRLGPRRAAVQFALLSPGGRPVQVTQDLRSFWERTYPEVRRELRGRYPRHPWPEDPWTAVPTHRTTRALR